MPAKQAPHRAGLAVLVLMVSGLVHAAHAAPSEQLAASTQRLANPASPQPPSKRDDDPGPLPIPAEEMRQAILAATHSGDIEDLREPLDWNEIKPEVSAPAGEDPIAYWKRTSGDSNGREMLAALAEILSLHPARLPLGRDIENNMVYVWPYLAEVDLTTLSPAQEVELLRLVGPAEAKAMREKKKWTWWRLTIGADGTWHSFKKAD